MHQPSTFANCTARERRASHRLSQSTLSDTMLRSIDQRAFPAGLFGLTSATSISRNAHETVSRNAHETVRHHVEQMPTPVGDFRRQRPGANLLRVALKHSELFLFLPGRIFGAAIFTVGHSNHAPQAESDDAEGGPAADHHRIERARLARAENLVSATAIRFRSSRTPRHRAPLHQAPALRQFGRAPPVQ
jgi:hypothetical protein